MGTRMMKPTSKNTGMASTSAAAVSAMGTRVGPSSCVKRLARLAAPPETSIMRPSMEPSATRMATEPSVPPMPAISVLMMSPMGMPVANATRKLTSIIATKAWTCQRMMSNRSRAMLPAPMPRSARVDMDWVSPGGKGRARSRALL